MGRRARYVGCTWLMWPCRRSAHRYICRTEVHTMGRQRPCLWQPCTAVRKRCRRICCACVVHGYHCSHYQDNGCSVARRHKSHSKGRRDRSRPCTAWRKGIRNRIRGSNPLFSLLFSCSLSLLSQKSVEIANDKLLLSELNLLLHLAALVPYRQLPALL